MQNAQGCIIEALWCWGLPKLETTAVCPLVAALDSQLFCVVKHYLIIPVAVGLLPFEVVLWVEDPDYVPIEDLFPNNSHVRDNHILILPQILKVLSSLSSCGWSGQAPKAGGLHGNVFTCVWLQKFTLQALFTRWIAFQQGNLEQDSGRREGRGGVDMSSSPCFPLVQHHWLKSLCGKCKMSVGSHQEGWYRNWLRYPSTDPALLCRCATEVLGKDRAGNSLMRVTDAAAEQFQTALLNWVWNINCVEFVKG